MNLGAVKYDIESVCEEVERLGFNSDLGSILRRVK
jgi:hypothetical protein